jgi:hypothetical protein
MFPLCWELSTRARWLVVIAPHKKPEVCRVSLIMVARARGASRSFADVQIKDGWGWARWDLREWAAAGDKVYRRDQGDEETELEIVRDK